MDVALNTFGSSFDTVLVAYRSTENGLTQVACSDDSSSPQSAVSFAAAGDTAYYFMVAGYVGAIGSIQLSYNFHLTNDAFTKAIPIKPGFTDEFKQRHRQPAIERAPRLQ